ncbi:FAD-dependent oxidoreductase [Enteractinococcus helveticum]|uniref:Reductase flavoprotein subunit n=1 Tax=Enteractinococcus helveticum TaxID=1837282 RepID=A0A1B7LUI4_9MICC|nr:FAD-dependent oxidoreductase [Enteractinococcus helveticum]OAV51047.1 reductase flavoprotein subunit [Enteractinococcus helveticum]
MCAKSYDVIVIGAGIAGLSSATAAIEKGLDVLLVEKMPSVGGSTVMSGGWFAFTGTEEQQAAGVDDSLELFRKDLLEVGGYRNDPSLVDAYLENQYQTYEWMKAKGVEFGEVEISSGQSVARGHSTRIREVVELLHQEFTSLGGKILLDTRITSLNREPGGCVTGVILESGETLSADRGVVIASGGFSRSTELLSIFAPQQLSAIPYGGPGNTGDGLKMAWKLGAGMADFFAVSGTYGSHPETTEAQQELLTSFYMGGIIVNTDAKRFVDESQDYKTLGSAVLGQDDAIAFQIFDATVRAKSHRGVALKDMDTLEDLGHLHHAATLEELAKQVHLPASQLVQTVENYNAAIRGEGEDEIGRTTLCNGVGELQEIIEPPFYAYPAKTLMTTTYAGVTINTQGQVTDVDGDVIDGLYAVGEVTGGFHGAAYMTGSSLGKGAVFGNIVAASLSVGVKEKVSVE